MARDRGASALMRDKTPFPARQMAILALCRICEPIAFMSIFPYAYYMVESFHIAEGKAQISMYVGMVTSAFAFAECASGVFWGRLSDRIGRKKVLLGGLFGTGLSMLLFGFASNLATALIARALGGLLNGNIGVLQTTVAELVTVEKHQPRAYSIIPSVWCLGTIIGASLGGLLAQPATNCPSLFKNTIFESYPYLLPNLVCTVVVVFGLTIGILFLEETHEDKKHERDRGREIGQWILQRFWPGEEYIPLNDKDGSFDEMSSMLECHDGQPYRSTCRSPTLCSSRSSITEPPLLALEKEPRPALNIRKAFTKQVCLNIICYGILAFHTISLEQLLPILMSRDHSEEKPHLPFVFKGGFEFSPRTIGVILSIQGVLQLFAQLIVFPWLSKKLGSLRTFWLTIATYPFLYFLAPYLALLPEHFRIPGIILLLVWKVTAQSLSYPSLAIMLANAAPSKKVLGLLNGAAASSASVCRGFGPTVSGAVDTFGDNLGVSGLAWWTCAGIAAIGWIPGFFMKEERRRPGFCNIEEDVDEEVGLGGAQINTDSDVDSIITLTPDETVETVLSK
ncbi:MFS general substrate transporter [Lindgomyces ingoldianus]|uniref:MFS general substrate transporter n=1 Tax=Lindgomyces ingoldianus TaxID=673940 RepID=A0ACB6QGE7_9PLEO|nr:MFS general substrate transporter [Lindgomyces ingoldianus]KAF2465580.1 MFS general substrate transporter [Lindgomyces ingoldianus]